MLYCATHVFKEKKEPYITLNCVSGDLKFKICRGRTPASLVTQAAPSPELPPQTKIPR